MNWKNKLTNYNFWISIVSAVLLILQAFDINFDIAYINEIVTAVLGLLVVIGIISNPNKTNSTDNSANSTVHETEEKADENIDTVASEMPAGEKENVRDERTEENSQKTNTDQGEVNNILPNDEQTETADHFDADNLEVLIKQISSDLNKKMSELFNTYVSNSHSTENVIENLPEKAIEGQDNDASNSAEPDSHIEDPQQTSDGTVPSIVTINTSGNNMN